MYQRKIYVTLDNYYKFIKWVNNKELVYDCYEETNKKIIQYILPINEHSLGNEMFILGTFPLKLIKWLNINCEYDFIKKETNYGDLQ